MRPASPRSPSYTQVKQHVDYKALELQSFLPGALVSACCDVCPLYSNKEGRFVIRLRL
jgi:hypothetical protein